MNPVHYSTASHMWATPQWLFDRLNAEFRFQTDVCAVRGNAKVRRFYSPRVDGLAQDWTGMCWMNPPFGGRGVIDPWIQKALSSAASGDATVVCLVPARTGSPWFFEHCSKGEIRFLPGKLYFNDGGAAPFNSAVVIFHAHLDPGGIVKFENWKKPMPGLTREAPCGAEMTDKLLQK
jgi:phage N-6-adenine-methyltransferase